jgi:hypothetical protein
MKKFKLIISKKKILIFLDKNLFFQQFYLKSFDKKISNKLYTLYYVLKCLENYGLIQITKKK